MVWLSFFFFSSRRRHTRFDCDWSSDVCSSDLPPRSPDAPVVCLLFDPTVIFGGHDVSGDPFGGSAFPCMPGGGEIFGCELPAPTVSLATVGTIEPKQMSTSDVEDMETA